jgi:Na+/phosphate symporter
MAEQTIKDLKKEIYLILHKAQYMLELTEEGFMKSKVSSLDEADEVAGEIRVKEDSLTSSFAKLAATNSEARLMLSVPASIEKIATNIHRIGDNSRVRIKDGLLFSDKAVIETGKLFTLAKDILKKAGEAVVTNASATINTVVTETDSLERMANDFATTHEERLVTGECSPKSSSNFLSILYAFDDMGEHIKNTVKKMAGK